MSEWLGWAFGSLCAAFVAVRVAGLGWCLVELRRNWRGAPELWGIDWLDVVVRVEREFGVGLTAADFADWSAEARFGLTAGQLWELVAGKLRATGRDEPPGGWPRMVAVLCEALNVRLERVARSSRLYADLGMAYGLE